ncbi:hypothetical protein [Cryobacterium roopkundense]|uniref:Uncharacterized protein n=1 Tax=Cryobacterium roopkundense TaxID=1001240 RepID=A0A7W8ZYX1_9MICO|nr:hypothetical protein [Cryobacterium roopkundense]MBB5642794.1 hypothetical protein [Cryobacterium roopkundense]
MSAALDLGIPGPLVDRSLLAAVSFTFAALLYLVLRRSPRLAIALWISVLCFVPVWVGIGFGAGFALGVNGKYYLSAATILAMVVSLAVFSTPSWQFSIVDGLVALLVFVGLASLFTAGGGIALAFMFTLVTYFVVGFVLGRLAPLAVDIRWIYGAVAVAFTIVAALAVLEFATGWNPFVGIPGNGALYSTWAGLQGRGGIVRAEGAFGHSIALGSSLAMAIPLALSSRFRLSIRAAMVALMLVATVVTFSRIAIVGAVLGLTLSIVFLRDAISRRLRVILVSSLVGVSVVAVPFLSTVFEDAGTEASGSAAYRGDLLSLLTEMNIIGLSDSARRSPAGQTYFGNFRSIDSQLILTGLTSGILTLACVVVLLLAAIALVLRRRATAATIAIVAQIPALATVALITQYSIFLWFVVGLAAAGQVRSSLFEPQDGDRHGWSRDPNLTAQGPPAGSGTHQFKRGILR